MGQKSRKASPGGWRIRMERRELAGGGTSSSGRGTRSARRSASSASVTASESLLPSCGWSPRRATRPTSSPPDCPNSSGSKLFEDRLPRLRPPPSVVPWKAADSARRTSFSFSRSSNSSSSCTPRSLSRNSVVPKSRTASTQPVSGETSSSTSCCCRRNARANAREARLSASAPSSVTPDTLVVLEMGPPPSGTGPVAAEV
mmetsp:Transcript_2023/g.6452  ORF Transcript_2023/g.6452 Transcript_2023/m.6452 type:complete len:201 (+) Transcript_2023:690-1292(+)